MTACKYICVLVALAIVGCSGKKTPVMDDDHMIMSVIESYVSDHPDYNTFVVYDSWNEFFEDSAFYKEFPPGYILGPCYQNQLKQKDSYSYIDVGNSRVYIKSTKLRLGKEKGKENWTNTNPLDTVVLKEKDKRYLWIEKDPWGKRDPWFNNLLRAIYLYKKDNVWYINNRPDSIFFPERVETDIHFP